jgi:hypothetical protein
LGIESLFVLAKRVLSVVYAFVVRQKSTELQAVPNSKHKEGSHRTVSVFVMRVSSFTTTDMNKESFKLANNCWVVKRENLGLFSNVISEVIDVFFHNNDSFLHEVFIIENCRPGSPNVYL